MTQAAIITDYTDTYVAFAYQDREMLFDVQLSKLQQRPKSNLQITIGAFVVEANTLTTKTISHRYSYLAASSGELSMLFIVQLTLSLICFVFNDEI